MNRTENHPVDNEMDLENAAGGTLAGDSCNDFEPMGKTLVHECINCKHYIKDAGRGAVRIGRCALHPYL